MRGITEHPSREGIVVEGDFGAFEGSPDDRVVLGHYQRTGSWSPDLCTLIAKQLFGGGGGTLIDVGANLGLTCVPILQRCTARAIVFEPAPDNHDYLLRNLSRHGMEARVEAHRLALSDTRATLRLSPCRHNSGDQHLVPAGSDAKGAVDVEATTLDDVLSEARCARPIVMKVDTQGAEAAVLRGAEHIAPHVEWLVVEYWPFGLLRAGASVEALHEQLLRWPYACVLGQRPPRALASTQDVLDSLAWIARDGSDRGFFDLLLGRCAQVPDAP